MMTSGIQTHNYATTYENCNTTNRNPPAPAAAITDTKQQQKTSIRPEK